MLQLVQFPNGALGVVGPVDDIVKAYGLVEIMRDLIRAHHAAKQEGRGGVVPATAGQLHSLDDARSGANGSKAP